MAYRSYPMPRDAAFSAPAEERARFIVRTYLHLFGAILAFAGIEAALLQLLPNPEAIAMGMVDYWWMVIGAFMVVSWLASSVAAKATSKPAQYAALGGFVLIEAIIFMPLLLIAQQAAGGDVIFAAAAATLAGFTGLTAIAIISRKDFSFLKTIVFWGMWMALATIVISLFTSFTLGPLFSCLMIALAGGAMLYQTSDILRHYPTDRHVSAALGLFASVALMFYYVLMLFLQSRD